MDLGIAGDVFGGGRGLGAAVVGAVFLAGLRHGFDIDHIAAITDITSSQSDRRRSLVLATTYALGHTLVLFSLGLVAVFAGKAIPDTVDSIAGRVIGLTLVSLGIYVIISLIRFRKDFRMRSRWMLVVGGVRRVLHWMRASNHVVIEHAHPHSHDDDHTHIHEPIENGGSNDLDTRPAYPSAGLSRVKETVTTHAHTHTHLLPMPPDPFTEYGVRTSFLVGMVHGVGAETPTQVLLFSTAAGVAGTLGGVALVATFVAGLLMGNSILAIATTLGFGAGKRVPAIYMGLAATTAVVSIYVGGAYLVARPDILPSFLGG